MAISYGSNRIWDLTRESQGFVLNDHGGNQNQPLCATGPVYPALCFGDRSCLQFFPVCWLIRFSAGNSRKTAIINFFRIFVLNSRVGNTSVSGN